MAFAFEFLTVDSIVSVQTMHQSEKMCGKYDLPFCPSVSIIFSLLKETYSAAFLFSFFVRFFLSDFSIEQKCHFQFCYYSHKYYVTVTHVQTLHILIAAESVVWIYLQWKIRQVWLVIGEIRLQENMIFFHHKFVYKVYTKRKTSEIDIYVVVWWQQRFCIHSAGLATHLCLNFIHSDVRNGEGKTLNWIFMTLIFVRFFFFVFFFTIAITSTHWITAGTETIAHQNTIECVSETYHFTCRIYTLYKYTVYRYAQPIQ